jgi:hypothetical protein
VETVHDFGARTLNNRSISSPLLQRTVTNAGSMSLRVEITDLPAEAYLQITGTITFPNGAVWPLNHRFDKLGKNFISFWVGHSRNGTATAEVTVEAVGRIDFSAQLVTFAQDEDIAEWQS